MTSEKATSIVSFVFNPTGIAAFTFLILLYPENAQSSLLFMGVCVTFGTLVPFVMMYQFSKRGLISDFCVSEKEEVSSRMRNPERSIATERPAEGPPSPPPNAHPTNNTHWTAITN